MSAAPEDRGSETVRSTRRLVLAGVAILLIPILGSVLLTRDLPDLQIGTRERTLLPLLVAARLLLFWRWRRPLVPWLDLPILGLLFVFTGAATSPLDPALFFVYALLAFHLEPSPGGVRTMASFIGGIFVMYGFLFWHVRDDGRRVLADLRADLAETIEERRRERRGDEFDRAEAAGRYARLREAIDADREAYPAVREESYFAPADALPADAPSLDRAAARTFDAIERRQEALRRTLAGLRADLGSPAANALTEELAAVFPETDTTLGLERDALLEAVDRITTSPLRKPERVDYQAWLDDRLFGELDARLAQQDEVRAALDDVIARLHELDFRRVADRKELNRLITERVALAILILATLSLVAALRRGFEREVERREQERADRELAEKARETENWIALTAGLTHTIGNDILAYDAYGEEALDALEELEGEVPPEISHNVRFIVDSNKARLGFIKFLDEFARARKESADGGVRPVGLARIPLPTLLRSVRRQVGEVEVADLPRESRDPQVVRQRRKFLELPLEVDVKGEGEDAGTLTRGKRGILQFFCYELIKNGLRNCSGEQPLRVEVEKGGGRVRIRFVNDLAVKEVRADDGSVRFVLPRIAGMAPVDEDGLRERVGEILDRCFEPGRGGGTGLGLFLIRYFAREYYSGSIEARIHDWDRRLVAFELELPDDLEEMAT